MKIIAFILVVLFVYAFSRFHNPIEGLNNDELDHYDRMNNL